MTRAMREREGERERPNTYSYAKLSDASALGIDASYWIYKKIRSGLITNSAISKAIDKFGTFNADGSEVIVRNK